MANSTSAPAAETGAINILYIAFNGNVPPSFAAMAVVRWTIAMLGFVLNASLLYVAVKADSLQGTCNFLIAFNAFCQVVLLPFMTIGFVLIISPGIPDFIPIQTCFWLQFIPLFFGSLFIISMLAIALDRLLSVLLSVWHSRQDKVVYLSAVLVACICYAIYNVYTCYVGVQQHRNILVFCLNPGETYQGETGNILFRLTLIVISLCIFCYLLIWVIVRKNGSRWNGTFTQKILKSLIAMVCVISLGYFVSTAMRVVSPFLDTVQFAYTVFGTSIMSILSMTANAPVLYLFSNDYRVAFRKHLPRFISKYLPFAGDVNVTMATRSRFTRVGPTNNRGSNF